MRADRLGAALHTRIPGCAWAMWFDANGKAHAGEAEDAGDMESATFQWLHFDRSDVRVPGVLRDAAVLDEDSRDALTAQVDHQYVEVSSTSVYGAIIDHETTLEGRNYETDFLRFAFNDRLIVTSRRKPLQSAETVRLKISKGDTAKTPLAVFEMLAGNICDCIAKMNREIALDLDRIEDRVIFEDSGRAQRVPLGRARREAVRLARQIGGIHSTVEHLAEAANENEREDLAETSETLLQRCEALSRDVSNLQDRARALQEEVNAILTLETNDRLYSLTIITTLILPATFVTGLFGMNTQRLFFADNENGTLWATVLCFAASALALVTLRRLGFAKSTGSDPSLRSGRRA